MVDPPTDFDPNGPALVEVGFSTIEGSKGLDTSYSVHFGAIIRKLDSSVAYENVVMKAVAYSSAGKILATTDAYLPYISEEFGAVPGSMTCAIMPERIEIHIVNQGTKVAKKPYALKVESSFIIDSIIPKATGVVDIPQELTNDSVDVVAAVRDKAGRLLYCTSDLILNVVKGQVNPTRFVYIKYLVCIKEKCTRLRACVKVDSCIYELKISL